MSQRTSVLSKSGASVASKKRVLLVERARLHHLLRICAVEPRHQMRRADEHAEQAVAVDVALEERDAAAAEDIAPLPVAARFGVEREADEAPVGGQVRA